ncbi:MAG TPA: glycosyltransferase family 2 protein [Anaerolineaceae bacterium]
MIEQPLVINVILNTSRRDDTLACLESLAASSYPRQQTIVLDNASTDGSAEAIRARYPQVQVIPLTRNLGYAGNNNAGIRAALEAGADWVFVLNEDTVLDPDCTSRLVETAVLSEKTGILGPLVYHGSEPGTIQSAGGALDGHWQPVHIGQNEADIRQFTSPREVDWISGCAILVRREVIDQVGALDERFFYYWEETDWCLRARQAGWLVVQVPQAKLWHKGVQRDYRPGPNITYYAARNKLMLMAKHRAPASAWAYTYLNAARTLLSWTVRPRWRGMKDHRTALWQGMLDFSFHRYGRRRD